MEALDSVLFGKYQLCRILGSGRVGTVFLAVHLGLSEYRAIKRVPKSIHDHEHFRREALILKELRHPGIPIIYDIEEDENYSYLIEEYLEGESLYDLVKRQGHLSQELVIRYGIQLTCIIKYLHSAGTNPILYLDLQPKNLLLCHESIKLIDFDRAAFPEEANALTERYGTVGCAAPEQYEKDRQLDERTDLYAIGTILHFLYTGTFPVQPYRAVPSMNPQLASVIATCLEEKPERRFSSAQELETKLTQLEENGAGRKSSLHISSLTIALTGSKRGAGTTHVAVGLSVYLRNQGYPNLYEEKNNSGMGAGLCESTGAAADHYGIYQYRHFWWKPAYGQEVRLQEPPFGLRILDYGGDVRRAVADKPDLVILICDSREWNQSEAGERAGIIAGSRLPYVIAYNHVAKASRIRLTEGVKREWCVRVPYFADPFEETEVSGDFYRSVLELLIGQAGEQEVGLSGTVRHFKAGKCFRRRRQKEVQWERKA